MTEESQAINYLGHPIIGFSGHRNKTCHPDYLFNILYTYNNAVWVHGGAKNGFDFQVSKFCKDHNIREIIVRPRYEDYKNRNLSPTKALLDRNIEIVEIVSTMYFLYDGRTKGGTFYTLEYAKKQNKRYNLIPLD